VSWRVFATDATRPDFAILSDADRDLVAEELFRWVEVGPPRKNRRVVSGAEIFEDALPNGILVTYFTDEHETYVGLLRVRRHPNAR